MGETPLLVANADDAEKWFRGLVVAKDIVPNAGSLGGVYSVVARSPDPVLIVAWDMPFLSSELMQALIAGSDGYDVFLPASRGPLGAEPLCGVYTPQCAAPIKAALDAEDYRTQSFHDDLRVGTLPLAEVETFGDPEVLFFNVNTPSDIATAEELWKRQQD